MRLVFGATIKTLIIILLLLVYSPKAIDSDINFAPGIDPQDLKRIHPKLRDIVAFVAVFCKENDITFVITSAIRSKQRNAEVGGLSETHVEGRAIDFSIKPQWGWTPRTIGIITQKVIQSYKYYGAFSKSANNKQVVIFNHDAGNGYHMHLQIYKGLPWN